MSIEEYRQEILSVLLNVKNTKGEPRFDEASAKELLRQLSDEELEEGMLFNTPKDVAEVLSEVGKLWPVRLSGSCKAHLHGLLLKEERYGNGAFEITLHISTHHWLKIRVNPIKTDFVTIKESKGYKEACKRCPFALQNMPFYSSKGALLQCKRAPFVLQKSMYWLAYYEILLHTLSFLALWFYISMKRKEQYLQWIC